MIRKSWPGIAVVVLLVLMILNLGCWGRKFFRMPGEMMDTSEKVDSLLRENNMLQRRVYYLEKKVEQQAEFTRNTTAKNKIDLEEIKDQLNALQEMVRGRGVQTAQRGMGEESEVKEGGGEYPSTPRDTVIKVEGLPTALDTAIDEGVAVPTDTGGGEGDIIRAGGDDYFPRPDRVRQRIYLEYNRSNYRLALEESNLFLDEYPDHPLAEDVHFIRGECFVELREYFDALREFSLILQRYPEGKYVSSSLLRMVIAYEAIGETELAAGVARRLIREYPHSEEAGVAKERFADILDQ